MTKVKETREEGEEKRGSSLLERENGISSKCEKKNTHDIYIH
jgi:hypothetical protein